MARHFLHMDTRASKRYWHKIKRQWMLICALIVFSGYSFAVQQDNPPSSTLVPFDAVYTAYKWDGDVGTAELKLEELGDGHYSLTYSSKVSKFFLSDKRFEHSIFHFSDGEFIPQEYHYTRTGTGPDKELDVIFKHGPSSAIVVKQKQDIANTGQLDNQLYRLDVPLQLAAGKKAFEYDYINYRGDEKSIILSVVGLDALSLPYGEIEAIKVRIVRHNSTRETFIWFAPSLNYQLVRLQQFKDGDEQGDIKLKSFTYL